jgi:phage-related protein
MATFPSITPTYGIKKKSSPAVRTVQFGDGYEQRLSLGLNQNPKSYNLTFEVSETDADTIETFLDARAADSASFDFTPPGESSSSKFVCEQWDKSIPYLNRATIQTTFREVFEP